MMPTTTDERAERVQRFFERVWNARDAAAADDLYGPKFTDPHAPGLTGGAAKTAAIAPYQAAFPDLRMRIEELVACDDEVAVRFCITGTDSGSGFAGRPPTGRSITSWGVNFLRFDADTVAEEWVGVDYLGVFLQLGVIASPWPEG